VNPVTGEVIHWDNAENAKHRKEHGIGFEGIIVYIERGDLIDGP
jgi:hypothetical protein